MMNLTMGIMAFAAVTFAPPAPAAAEPAWGGNLPAIYAQGDVADAAWRAARRAIADEEWDRAADLFAQLRGRYPKSAYIGDSYYWQAYSLYQKGNTSSLRTAVSLLDTQRNNYNSANTYKSGEAPSLRTRISGMLARGGDEDAAASIARSATAVGVAGASIAESALRIAASAMGEAAAEVASELRNSGRASSGRSSNRAQSGCKDEEDDERVMALNALLQMNSDDALPLLKRVLERRDACSESLRRKAVFLVAQKSNREAADILMTAAEKDPDAEVREQAVFWLGQVNSERATTLLEQILRTSKDEAMQDKALFSLGQGGRGQKALRDYAVREDAPERLRETAIFWLGQRKSTENAAFLRELFEKTREDALKEKIIFSLSQTRSTGNGEFILEQATNPSNSMALRKHALFWAGQSGAVDVSQLGTMYDRTNDREFREQVIFVLSQKGKNAAAIDKLIDIARTEKDRDLRQKAIFWLGQSNDARALKALQEIILKTPE